MSVLLTKSTGEEAQPDSAFPDSQNVEADGRRNMAEGQLHEGPLREVFRCAQPRRELQDSEPQEDNAQCQPSNQYSIFSHEG